MGRRFEWTERMGRHLAYHESVVNKVVHLLCIPLQLWGVVHLLANVPYLGAAGLVALLSPLFVLCDVLTGASFAVFLVLLSVVASDAHVLWGPTLFVCANVFQTRVGHAFEEGGRDDTALNMAEFKRSRNPIPLLLIFYYHWVEVFLWFGYAPDVRAEVQRSRERTQRAWR